MLFEDLLADERKENSLVDLAEWTVAASLTYLCIFDYWHGYVPILILGLQFAILLGVLGSIALRWRTGINDWGFAPVLIAIFVLIGIGTHNAPNAAGWIFTAMVVSFATTSLRFSICYAAALGLAVTWALLLRGEVTQLLNILPAYLAATAFMYAVTHRFHKYQKDLLTLSSTDSLTGCFNRGCLDRISLSPSFAKRRIRPLLVDLDKFKTINDRFGHRAGDQTLVAFARTLETLVGKRDMLFRLGGDEFLILLGQTDRGYAARLQDAIAKEIAKTKRLAGLGVSATTGVGPSSRLADWTTSFEIADQDMLAAKARPEIRD